MTDDRPRRPPSRRRPAGGRRAQSAAGDLARMGIDPRALGLAVPTPPTGAGRLPDVRPEVPPPAGATRGRPAAANVVPLRPCRGPPSRRRARAPPGRRPRRRSLPASTGESRRARFRWSSCSDARGRASSRAPSALAARACGHVRHADTGRRRRGRSRARDGRPGACPADRATARSCSSPARAASARPRWRSASAACSPRCARTSTTLVSLRPGTPSLGLALAGTKAPERPRPGAVRRRRRAAAAQQRAPAARRSAVGDTRTPQRRPDHRRPARPGLRVLALRRRQRRQRVRSLDPRAGPTRSSS